MSPSQTSSGPTGQTGSSQTSSEHLRRELSDQRQEIGRDLEAIGDRVSPGRIADRSRERTRRRVTGWKDRVMGSAEQVRASITDHVPFGGSNGGSNGAPSVSERVEGNPLAVGMVAFGFGFILGSALPASRKEEELAQAIEPQLERMAEDLGETARGAADRLSPTVEQEMSAVKDEAKAAASSTVEAARDPGSSGGGPANPT
jgi:hypothetical protein